MNAPEAIFAEVSSKTAAGKSTPHESAIAQVQGAATYVDDIPELKGTLYAAPILSNIAHGKFKGFDASEALAMPGVTGVVSSADIPGEKILATYMHDEPIFAFDKVEFIGQVVGLVIADSVMNARRAARKVKLDISLLAPVLDVREAIEKKNFVLPPITVTRGDPVAAMKSSKHRLSGSLSVGGQEHFYLEGQIAYALPLEQNQWWIYSSTQHPGEVQHWVAHALGVDSNAVRVECRRMGGGFGGKETQCGHLAVWASLAARKFNRPIKLRLDRDDDFMVTGKRHPFEYDYEVGFDDSGLITAMKLMIAADCGFSADLSGPVADRAVFHADNAYYLSDVEIVSYRCKTNRQSHTAFRGFGGPQGMIVTEAVMGEIARTLKLDPLDVRLVNLYGTADRNVTHYQMTVEDNIARPLMTRLEKTSRYRLRRKTIAAWNDKSPVIKRGIALTPLKFGISFTASFFNQAGALVHVYTDGSVQVNHGGTEMGQGLHTKVAQIVADELGVRLDRVLLTASDTSKVPNASATAASAGTDLNARAAQFAARQIRERLSAFVGERMDCDPKTVIFMDGQVSTPKGHMTFEQVIDDAYHARVQLWSDGFYKTPKIHYDAKTLTGRPFFYFAYGAAVSEVAIDTLTGETRVLKVDILHDVGRSINPAIDIGQIEGGFVQGMGWVTNEQLVWNDKGYLQTHAPSTYKIPATGDIPAHFKVDLWPEPNREDNVFGSKAVGEPPFMLALSVWEAIRDAIASTNAGSTGGNTNANGNTAYAGVRVNAPATAENVLFALHNRQLDPLK